MRPIGPVAVLPYQGAAQLLLSRDPGNGQSAGPPGQGPEPPLVHEPGGDTVRRLLHPDFQIFEELYRVLPEEGWFNPNLSPSNPVQFELGSFQVPKGQQLWLFDYSFQIFRQSGFDAGDMMPMEEGRLSGILGFDININGRRLSHLLYQIDPVPVQLSRQSFDPPTINYVIGGGATRAVPAQFNRAAANSFAANSNVGTSLLPVRRQRQGPDNGVFTFVVPEDAHVSLNVVIFKPVPTPITAIEGRHGGYLIHTQTSNTLVNRLRPR